MKIDHVDARAIPDSRGNPTVEVTVRAGDYTATASVPSGKSTGAHEAKELRDSGGGVEPALQHIRNAIAPALYERDFETPDELDCYLLELDGTSNKAYLGANAILPISIAMQRLFAQAQGVPLWQAIAERGDFVPRAPRLFVNVMNGGEHADYRLPLQEHLLVCEGKTSTALTTAKTAFAELGSLLGDVPIGDEGGYSPSFDDFYKPFDLLKQLVEAHGGTSIAIDAAANALRTGDGEYALLKQTYSAHALGDLYEALVARYPFHSIEDPFAEDDPAAFARLTAKLEGKCLVVGDDLTVTNPTLIRAAAERKAITAVLIKPNQIGTVKEAVDAVHKTRMHGWAAICSHRSGETMDTFIADFAYGVGAHGIKAGGFAQKERLAKYERLLEIEQEAQIAAV